MAEKSNFDIMLEKQKEANEAEARGDKQEAERLQRIADTACELHNRQLMAKYGVTLRDS